MRFQVDFMEWPPVRVTMFIFINASGEGGTGVVKSLVKLVCEFESWRCVSCVFNKTGYQFQGNQKQFCVHN